MIDELIFHWARRTPRKTALLYNERALSYRALAEEITRARAYFIRRGYAGPGYAVLAFRNLLDFWIFGPALRSLGLTTVAVGSAADVAALPLTRARCVITPDYETWPDLARVCATRGWELVSVSLKDEPAPSNDARGPSRKSGGHILLTSGTTGTYKMVLIDHAIDSFQMRRKMDILRLNEDAVFCVFDFTPWTGIGYRWAAAPLVAGGTMVIDQGREPYRALLHPGMTHAVLTPSRLDPILDAPEGTLVRNETMELIVGGGTLTLRQVEDTKALLTPRIFNCLASTEASIIAHTPLQSPDDMRWHKIISDRAVEIVDDADRPVAEGQLGRLRVSTAGGSRGYLDNEDATAAFFKNGYFYPGDLAIRRSDGRITLQGRSTDVINLKGHKFFPGPIEDQLQKLLDVTGVCLLSMQNDSGEEELHVAIETPTPLEDERLHAALKTALNAYPRAHIHVRYFPSLPRNPMGKIERQAVRTRVKASGAATS